MKHILVILLSIVSVTVYSQSPRIKLNQIVKDNAVGSILISNPTDSQMVYSRDFFINFGTDTTLVLFGDTIGGGISTVVTDLVTIQGDGSIATPLYVDTSVINTIKGMVDTLAARGYLTTEVDGSTTNEIQTLSKVGQTVSLSLSGGSFTDDVLTETEVDAFVANNGYLTSEVDGSISNEGSLTVQAGGANDSEIQSNTSGSTNVTIAGGSNVTVTESGNTITIASTATGGGSIPVDTFVTIAGTDTITGAKTFTSDLNVDGKIALNAGDNNVVIGDGAGASLVSGQALSNVLIGTNAGAVIDSGDYNIAIAYEALNKNTTGENNIANGYQALYNNTTANNNIANGYQALYSNISGSNNTANGFAALYSNSSGDYNIANGFQALRDNISGSNNIANGYRALYKNTSGDYNIANGREALYNTTGSSNIANGTNALFSNGIGSNNVAYGVNALYSLSNGSNNQGYGINAGRYVDGGSNLTTANGSIFLGNNTKASANLNSNEIVIGTNAIGNGSNSVTIGAITNELVVMKGRMELNDGGNSVFIGDGAGSVDNGSNRRNVGVGYQALYSNTSGYYNVANGYQALYNSKSGYSNIANGYQSLYTNDDGYQNVSVGFKALYENIEGYRNVGIGFETLYKNNAFGNIGIGFRALYDNVNTNYNTAIGYDALGNHVDGSENFALGSASLFNKISGGNNVAIGANSGRYVINTTLPLDTIYNSIFIGATTKGTLKAQNEIVIGYNAQGNGSNTITLGDSLVTQLNSGNYEFDIGQTVDGTKDNYVLTYDSLDGQISLEPATGGTATIPVDTFVTIAGTDTITGAKTFTNTFTQSGGDANFDNNTLYVDESADMVGIGKNNPSYKLDVNGDVNSEVKYIKLRRNSNLALSTTSLTNVTWDNTVAKDDDIFSHTSGQEQIYADVSGLYHITVNLSFFNDDLVDRSTIRARLVKNTTVQTHSAGYTYLRGSIGHINGTITISDMIELSTNDYVFVILDIVDSDGTNETLIATESQIIIRRLGY